MEDLIWLSAHIYHRDDANLVLTALVSPIIKKLLSQNLIQNYFFIRYQESGPHIRLRLQIRAENELKIRDIIIKKSNLFDVKHPAKNRIDMPENVHWHTDRSVHFIPYTQEINRYGNAYTISMAELQFNASSSLILHLLAQRSNDWNKSGEIIFALKLHLAMLTAMHFTLKEICVLCKLFVKEWLPIWFKPELSVAEEEILLIGKFDSRFVAYKEQLVPAITAYLEQLKVNSHANDAFKLYFEINQKVSEGYTAQQYPLVDHPDIITSFMHMIHNRLGISNYDESFTVYLLLKCLEIIAEDE